MQPKNIAATYIKKAYAAEHLKSVCGGGGGDYQPCMHDMSKQTSNGCPFVQSVIVGTEYD